MLQTDDTTSLKLRTGELTDWCSGNIVDLYMARIADILTNIWWLSSVPPGKYWDSTLIWPRPMLPSEAFQIHHSSVILPFDAMSKY
jgi:hypothetical protein